MNVNSYIVAKDSISWERANFLLPIVFCLILTAIVTLPAQAQDARVAAKFQLGNAAMREGKTDEAIGYFHQVVALAPRMAEGYFNLGLADEQAGKHGDAVTALQAALRLKAAMPGANLFLGIAEYRLNHLEDASAALEREVKLGPPAAKTLMWLGVVYLAENHPEDAAVRLDQAAELDPKDLDIMYHRGRAHLLVSKNAYEKMFTAEPNFWRVHQVLAQAYGEADRHTDAITEYEMAIKAVPSEPGLHEMLGNEYWKSGEMDKAEASFSAELKIDKSSIMALYHLGRLRVTRGDAKGGVPLLQQALVQDPSLSRVEYYLGRGMAQLGENAEAVKHYEAAIKGDPEGDVAQQSYYQLAHLYRQMQRPDDSRTALARFQKLKQQADASQKHKFEDRFKPDGDVAEKQTE